MNESIITIEQEPIVVTVDEVTPAVIAEITQVQTIVDASGDTEVIAESENAHITIIEEKPAVVVEAAQDPVVNVFFGGLSANGSRFPDTFSGIDVANLVKALNGSITKGQMSIDLNAEIDATTTGLAEAEIALAGAIDSFNAGMLTVDAVVTRVDQTDEAITLSAARLDVVEGDIQTASVSINDAAIRLTVAEAGVGSHEARLVAQETLLSNEWTVKIQENVDGSVFTTGVGLVIYPDWRPGVEQVADTFVWFNGEAYRAKATHITSELNQPPHFTYWEFIPYGAKSTFGVLADSFFVQSPSGDKKVPFVIHNDTVSIDGTLMVSGTIYASALAANDIYSLTMQSMTWGNVALPGWKFDAVAGTAILRGVTMTFYDLSDIPTSLNDINSAEAEKLASIEAMATVGATWGSNVAGQPADEEIMNDVLALSIAQYYVDQTTYQAKITEIEGLMDGSISTWFYDYAPTLTNLPASDWTTTTLKDIHLGDLFYYQSGGTSHRFSKISGVYQWVTVVDSGVSEVLAIANAAQDTADSKRRVFVVQPVPPYDIGDLWDAGGTPRITKRCSVNKAAGTAYAAGDWLVLANAVTSTDQIIDGAGLGTTATWTGVSGIPNDFVAQGNLITPYDDWVPGTSGAQGSFNINGTAAENRVVVGVGPLGGAEELWECLPDSGFDPDGGWFNDAVKVDPTKAYVWGCYFWRKDTTNGSTYLGCTAVETLAGVLNSNPYFWSGNLPVADKWYLVLGVVHPSGYTGAASGLAGVYDVTTGVKVISGTEFRFIAGTTTQRHRAYHYYNTAGNGITVYQRMARPFVFPASKFPSVSSLTTKLGGIAPSADVTGANTSYDTARVGGTSAATIRDNSLAAITATVAMEADSKFSIAEKRTWQIQWPGMSANYDAVRSAALLVDVSVAALDTAKTTLYNFLNTTHAVFATSPTNTTLVQGDLKTKVAAFYTAMQNAVNATANAYTDNIDPAAMINTKTTTIAGNKITTGTLAADRIVAASITATQIAAATITGAKIVANTITATQIAASTITATQIASNAITAVKIAAGTITADKIVANSLTASQIAANSITASELAANSVTAVKIAALNVTAGKLAAGSVVTSNIVAGNITTETINGNAVTLAQAYHYAGTTELSSTSFTTLASLTVVSIAGARTLINLMTLLGSANYAVIQLLRGPTLLRQVSAYNAPLSMAYVDTPGAGTFTYYLKAARSATYTVSASMTAYTFSTLTCKR